jgi:hypothetical protein
MLLQLPRDPPVGSIRHVGFLDVDSERGPAEPLPGIPGGPASRSPTLIPPGRYAAFVGALLRRIRATAMIPTDKAARIPIVVIMPMLNVR